MTVTLRRAAEPSVKMLLQESLQFLWVGSGSRYGCCSNLCGALAMAAQNEKYAQHLNVVKAAQDLINKSINGEPSFRIWYEDNHPQELWENIGCQGWQKLRRQFVEDLMSRM